LLGRPGCDFSFSGLKTAVAQLVARYPAGPLPAQDAADIAAGFQCAVAEVLRDRAEHALTSFAAAHGPRLLVVAGGVAANEALRAALAGAAEAQGFRFAAPPLRLCTDNAVMVAWAGVERLRLGLTDELSQKPRPRWPLEELSAA
jgi:N6-L-threonylcarbamoyladenine synthase